MKSVAVAFVAGALLAMATGLSIRPSEQLDISPYSPIGECPPRDTNTTIFLPDSENCTIYYLCSNGKPILNACPPDMSWNTERNICDWDIDSGCTAGNRRGLHPLSAVGDCPPKDPPTPVYLPDSERCDIYYECSGGVAFQNDCPPGLEFNPKLLTCDFPIDAGCNGLHANSTLPPSSSSSSTTSTTTTTVVPSATTKGPSAVDIYTVVGECPPRDSNVTIFLTDDANCTLYYICSNGKPILNSCPPGQAWNSELKTCDWDINVDCDLRARERNVASPYGPVGECPIRDGQTPVFLPDSEACNIYYLCSNGKPIQNECPPDMSWNPDSNICDWEIDVDCKSSGTTISTNSTSSTSTSTTTTRSS